MVLNSREYHFMLIGATGQKNCFHCKQRIDFETSSYKIESKITM